MPRQLGPHRIYRTLPLMYPQSYRRQYSQQMIQTLDGMLLDRQNAYERTAVWFRIGRDLPLSIVKEHINNWEGKKHVETYFWKTNSNWSQYRIGHHYNQCYYTIDTSYRPVFAHYAGKRAAYN